MNQSARTKAKFTTSSRIERFAEVLRPEDAEQPILSLMMREALKGWLTEIWAADELKQVNIKPRRSALLEGPPGCGKTTLAHHLAARMGVALVCVKMEALVGSHLGSTGNNIGELFDALAGQEDRHILFMDEFDSLATKRTEDNQACARELNAAVNTLLRRIENSNGIIIAATNRADSIDPALWRRFGLHLKIEMPGDDERFAIIKRYLDPFTMPDDSIDDLAASLAGAPPSLLRQVVEGIKRELVLGPRTGKTMDAFSILSRIRVSVRPHGDYPQPALYRMENAPRELAKTMAWPPQRTEKPAKAA